MENKDLINILLDICVFYIGAGFRPLHIIIKKIKLYANHMNVLADNNELLKYIDIWNKIEVFIQ